MEQDNRRAETRDSERARRRFRIQMRPALLVGLSVWTLGVCGANAGSQDREGTAKAGHAVLATLQEAFITVADDLEPAVVTVVSSRAIQSEAEPRIPSPFAPRNLGPRRATGTGSGVIISKDGWILTNDHVVGGADRVSIKLHDGREFVGTVRRDYRSDLALVKVESATPLPVAKLGDSEKVKIGQWAIAIGSPFRYEGSFSVGVVSSLFRRQEIADSSTGLHARLYPNMIQTDAAINPGNSGGPLCNIDGEVIGINTAIESESGGSVGIGFAIPVNTVKFVVSQLQTKGHVDYGYLGVEPTTVLPRWAAALKVSSGALIKSEPLPDSPAAKAGIHAGDVVTAINDRTITNEIELRSTVAQTAPKTVIDIAYVRKGQPSHVKVTLERMKDIADEEAPHKAAKSKLGIEVQALTPKLVKDNGLPTDLKGVMITMLDVNTSAAESEDLREKFIIAEVNDTPTPTPEAFQQATANLKSGDQVKIVYYAVFADGLQKRFTLVPVD